MKEISVNFDFSKFVNLAIPLDNVVVSDGLKKHLINSNHAHMVKYLPQLNTLLNAPDYIGRNPKQPNSSLEAITVLDDNILVAVKLDEKKGRYFVASVYDVTDSKLSHMVDNGRIVPVDKK